MATNRESKIQILYSSSSGATPDVGVLDYGELAINIVDNKLYFKGHDDSLRTFQSGGDVSSVNGHTGDVIIVSYGETAPSNPGTGDFWFESDTGSFYAYLDDGDSLQWVEINGQPGPTGPAGVSKYVAGFLYDGRGSNVATGTKTNVVRPVEQDSTVSDIHIRLSSGASGGSVTGYIYKVDSSYINASGASFDTDKVTVGEISISDGIYGATGATLSTPGLSAGDFLFGGVTGAGLTEIVQLFVNYEA